MFSSGSRGRGPAMYRVLLAGGCASVALMSAANAAVAQEASEDPGAAVEVSEIVVTGSRIARRDYASNSPLVSVTTEAIENTGQVTDEKALTQMPQFSGAMGQSTAGSSSTSLNGGQAYASLRGLGSKRTLLLRLLGEARPLRVPDADYAPLTHSEIAIFAAARASRARYGDAAIPFLAWARAAGCRQSVDGLGMLVEQAADSFALWHGVRPDTDAVHAELAGRAPALVTAD